MQSLRERGFTYCKYLLLAKSLFNTPLASNDEFLTKRKTNEYIFFKYFIFSSKEQYYDNVDFYISF